MGFGVTLSVIIFAAFVSEADDFSGSSLMTLLVLLSALGACLGVILGCFTRRQQPAGEGSEGVGLSSADEGLR